MYITIYIYIYINIDLSKAFYILDHNILPSKLKFDGVDFKAMNLLRSYLFNTTDQFVQLDNIKSNHHLMLRGIPPGSVSGPLLFNIVIYGLTSATAKIDHTIDADGTSYYNSQCWFRPLYSRIIYRTYYNIW